MKKQKYIDAEAESPKSIELPGFGDAVVGGLLEAFPDPCFILSARGIITLANNHALQLIHQKREDLLGSDFLALASASSTETIRRFISQADDGEPPRLLETELRRGAGGETVAVVLTVSSFASVDALADPALLVVAKDVSEDKRRELDLLRFSNIAHYTVNPIEITDAEGRITYVNPAFERASGYTKEELLGKNPNIFGSGKHPKSFWRKMWETIMAGKVWVGEVENRRRNGDPFYTHLLISPILDAEGQVVGYFGVHRDITEQKQLEQQLIHAQKMESIGLLAAGIAHEVGNPLTSISSLVQVIQRETGDPFTQEKLELIKSQISRISKTIRALVDFSRRSSYQVQLTDVNASIREAVEIVRVGRKAKDIQFHLALSPDIPRLKLVPDQIQQVFINVLINAVDEINAAGRELGRGGEVVVSSFSDGDDVVIDIRDNGRGISEDALPKIFEPFYTTKSVGEGTGLGLWVSYGIIKSFQGSISASSVEGEGATFTIRIPLHTEFGIRKE